MDLELNQMSGASRTRASQAPRKMLNGSPTAARVSAWLVAALASVGCGEGSSRDPLAAGSATPGGEADAPGTQGSAASQRWRSAEGGTGNPGISGVLTLNEYDWGCCTTEYLGIIQLDLATGTKRRFLDGGDPSRHANGSTSFWQFCGTGVNRLALADPGGMIRVVTGCSDQIPNSGDSPTYYGFSKLSPDARRIAAEVLYDVYFNPTESTTTVYDLEGNVTAEFEGYWAPAWTPDGRLLLTGEGFYLTSADLSDPQRIDQPGLAGPLNNPSVHPSGDRLAFEYNQQIWEMGLDGSAPRELVSSGARLRYPTYSADGRYIAYLSTPSEDYYDSAIYFSDLTSGEQYVFDVTNIIGNTALLASVVPKGPLSWTP